MDRVVRLGRHKSEALCRRAACRTPGVVAVAVRCSALESFAGGRAALPVYQHKGRMYGGARGGLSLIGGEFWIPAGGFGTGGRDGRNRVGAGRTRAGERGRFSHKPVAPAEAGVHRKRLDSGVSRNDG